MGNFNLKTLGQFKTEIAALIGLGGVEETTHVISAFVGANPVISILIAVGMMIVSKIQQSPIPKSEKK